MGKVEIFMMLYSLLLGLAMAGLLSGIGELLRGREAPRWGILVPLASAVLFTTLLGLFSDAQYYRDLDMSFRSIAPPAIAGVLYYLAAILTVPREHDGWSDLDAYFMARKHLIFGCLLAALVLIVFGIEVPRALEQQRPIFSEGAYWLANGTLLLLVAIPIVARHRGVIIASMVGSLAMLVFIYLFDQSIADTFRMVSEFVARG